MLWIVSSGTGGGTIRQLQQDTGARIDVDRDEMVVRVRGWSQDVVDAAIAAIKQLQAEDEGGGGGGGGGNWKTAPEPAYEYVYYSDGEEDDDEGEWETPEEEVSSMDGVSVIALGVRSPGPPLNLLRLGVLCELAC